MARNLHIRNSSLDVLKLFFTIVVIAHHSGYISGLLNRGYIAVEFFFITSGVFLFRTYQSHPTLSPLDYFMKRASRLYPEYWFSLTVLLIMQIILGEIAYKHWYSPILEFSLLRCIGIPLKMEALNGPCWYLSVLIFGGLVIFTLLRYLPTKLFNILAVSAAVMIYGFLAYQSGTIEQWDTVGVVFYLPFWRGMADMLVGTLLCQLPKPKPIVGNIAEVCCGLGILALLRITGSYDYIALALIAGLCWSISRETSLLRYLGSNKFVSFINRYQYSLYVNHICVIMFFRQIPEIQNMNHWIKLSLLVVATLGLSVLGNHITHLSHARSRNDKK